MISAVRKLYDPIAANGYEVPLEPDGGISRTDYERLPKYKTQQGKVVNYYYDPQLVYGILNVWPTADDPRLILSMDRPLQDVLDDAAFDVPQEAMLGNCIFTGSRTRTGISARRGLPEINIYSCCEETTVMNYSRSSASVQFEREWRR